MTIRSLLQYSRKFKARFQKDEDGVAAVEFAIVALPFFTLMFGTIELALIFFIGSSLNSSTFEASRLIRTGNFLAGSEDDFKTEICANLAVNEAECSDRLQVVVQRLDNFYATTNFSDLDTPELIDADGDGEADNNFQATAGGETVIVTATYEHPLTMPGDLTRLSNVDGQNIRRIEAISIFRNEPF